MPATLTTTTPDPIYPVVGQNYAPTKDLAVLKSSGGPTPEPSSLSVALLSKYNDYKQRDQEAWIEYLDTGRMVSNLRTGKLLLMRSVTDGRYLFVKRDGRFSDNKTVGGLFQFYSTKLTAEWLSSRPERDPICPSDDDQIEEFISNVKIVQDYYDRRFFTDVYETNECLSAQDYGTWITRYRFDPELQDVVCELLDFPACRWDMRFVPEESPYFLYESKCSNAVLEHLLNADIAPDDASDHYGLQLVEQLAKAGGNVAGSGKENPYGSFNDSKGENIVTEMWLQPEAYCDIYLDHDESTVGGGTLRKGRSLLQVFPDGLCAVGINGMRTIIGIYPENHKDHIVSGRYHIQSFSGVGKGISDAVDVKKEMDDLHSQTMAYIKAHSTPATYYNQDMITEEQARNIGKPRKVIPVDFTNAPDGLNSINQAIQSVTPQNPAGSVFEYKDVLNGWLQMSMQVSDFTNALPGVDNKTATGARIGDANAEMLLVPQHRNKGDHRRRSDKVIYNLFKKFVNKQKFFVSRAKNGVTAGKYLSGDQFSHVDIDFEVVANSEIPNNQYQQQVALTQFLQFTGGIGGLIEAAQMNPDMTGMIATTFGIKGLPIPKKNDIARVCRKRIEQAKKLLQVEMQNQQLMAAVGIPADNTNLAASIVSQLTPPVSPLEPYAREKASWMSELLDADEMNYAPQELRYVVEELIHRQMEASALGQAQLGQDENMAAVMANLPMLVGEQAANYHNEQLQGAMQAEQQAQQAEAQNQGAMQQAQLQLETEKQKAALEEERNRADHERAMEESTTTHEQAMELKTAEHGAKMQQIKASAAQAKAKAKTPPKK